MTENCFIIVTGKWLYCSLLMMDTYSRYLTRFEACVTNPELTHPGAMEFIDNVDNIPDSLCAVDKTMEETFMKFAKGSGGLLGIFKQYGAYQRWCRTTSERNKEKRSCSFESSFCYPKFYKSMESS